MAERWRYLTEFEDFEDAKDFIFNGDRLMVKQTQNERSERWTRKL
jgi:hypothetical protein